MVTISEPDSPGRASVGGRLVVDVVPRHRVAPAAGGGLAHGEDELLVEGPPQQLQGPPALSAVW